MDDADWNFTEQQAETVYTCEQLRDRQGLKPHTDIMLDIFFAPIEGEEPRREAFEKVLDSFGYALGEPDTEDQVAVSVGPIPFTPQDIWLHEERTTKMALARGYQPDGWGFAEAE